MIGIYELDLRRWFDPAWSALHHNHPELPACVFDWPANVPRWMIPGVL
jgi:hypothetical protein